MAGERRQLLRSDTRGRQVHPGGGQRGERADVQEAGSRRPQQRAPGLGPLLEGAPEARSGTRQEIDRRAADCFGPTPETIACETVYNGLRQFTHRSEAVSLSLILPFLNGASLGQPCASPSNGAMP